MSLITTDEAKTYLRVDSSMEDGLIDSLLMTAEKISADVGRMNAVEWEQLCDESTEEMTVHGEDIPVGAGAVRPTIHESSVFPCRPAQAATCGGTPCPFPFDRRKNAIRDAR